MSVSLCMIVRNESAHLGECLASVDGLVDETVVVDTGSSDDTVAIARRHGALVHTFPWCDDFAAARNASLDQATKDWVLWLDADDRVAPGSREELRSLLAALPDENVAYSMTIVSPGPDGLPITQAIHPRLFRRQPQARWQYRVHEQIAPALQRSGARLRPTAIQIIHVGYRHGADVLAKLERNLRLIDLELETSPLDGILLQHRAATLVGLRRGAEALIALNLSECSASGESGARNSAALAAQAHVQEGNHAEALEVARRGLQRSPRDTKLLFTEAELLAALGEFAGAEACLRAQIVVGEEHGSFVAADLTLASFRVRHLLADLLLHQGRPVEAELEARRIIEDRRGFGYAWLTLGRSFLAQGALPAFDLLCSGLGQGAVAEIMRAALSGYRHLREGDPARAVEVLEQALETEPTESALLKAYVRALFDAAERGSRLQDALKRALDRDPLCFETLALRRGLACAPRAVAAFVAASRAPRLPLGPAVSREA